MPIAHDLYRVYNMAIFVNADLRRTAELYLVTIAAPAINNSMYMRNIVLY